MEELYCSPPPQESWQLQTSVQHLKIGLLTEHVVHTQLVEHFDKNGIFHGNHYSGMVAHDSRTIVVSKWGSKLA